VILWTEPIATVAALVLATVTGLQYRAGYGHHHYACWGPVIPCIVNSKADLSAGLAVVCLSLATLGALTVLAILHASRPRRLLLWLLLVCAVVYWLGFIVVEAGIFVGPYALSAAFVLVSAVAAVARQAEVKTVRLKPGLLLLLSSVLLWFLSSVAAAAVADPIGLGPGIATGPPDAADTLLFAVPTGRDESGDFIGLDKFPAEELNRIQQGALLRPLRFVDADTPSTAVDVVSVNPIDRFTWSAVALSSRGDCLAILSAHDKTNPNYGNTYYGRLPKSSLCVASAATPATVTGAAWPTS
jgi:hypothetical protein